MRGVSVNILRSDLGDCTNGGATSPANSQGKIVIVFDPDLRNGNYALDKCKDDPRVICLRVVRRGIGTKNEYVHCEPINQTGNSMAGGNYVTTSDSRFRELSAYPIAVHDRIED